MTVVNIDTLMGYIGEIVEKITFNENYTRELLQLTTLPEINDFLGDILSDCDRFTEFIDSMEGLVTTLYSYGRDLDTSKKMCARLLNATPCVTGNTFI